MKFSRTVFFLLDGARPDLLKRLSESGKIPNLTSLFYKNGFSTTAVTTFPSTTGPAYLPFLTGKSTGECNIPGIRWLDKKKFGENAWGKFSRRSYVGLESFLFNADLNKSVKTIFEEIPNGYAIASILSKGAKKISGIKSNLHLLAILYAKLSHQWSLVDRMTEKFFFEIIDKNPTYVFCSFLSIDEQSHLSDPFSEKTIEAYVSVDQSIGKIIQKLKALGQFENTLFMASSDHGLSQTRHHFELWKFCETLGQKMFYYPNIFRSNVTGACMVSGNSFAHLYFKGKDGWSERCYDDELHQMNLIKPLASRPELDLIITQKNKNIFKVYSDRGEAEIRNNGHTFEYLVQTTDPFGYDKLPKFMTQSESLTHTFDTDYPDALFQISELFQSDRSGDILVTSKINWDLRDKFEIPEHFSSHGSLHKEHMLVPFLCNVNLGFPKTLRTTEIYPFIIKHMK